MQAWFQPKRDATPTMRMTLLRPSGDRARRPAAYDPSAFPIYPPSPIRPASTQLVPILHTVALTSRPASVIPQITRAPRTTLANPPPALATRSFATSALAPATSHARAAHDVPMLFVTASDVLIYIIIIPLAPHLLLLQEMPTETECLHNT
jgi:hypothetical protein